MLLDFSYWLLASSQPPDQQLKANIQQPLDLLSKTPCHIKLKIAG